MEDMKFKGERMTNLPVGSTVLWGLVKAFTEDHWNRGECPAVAFNYMDEVRYLPLREPMPKDHPLRILLDQGIEMRPGCTSIHDLFWVYRPQVKMHSVSVYTTVRLDLLVTTEADLEEGAEVDAINAALEEDFQEPEGFEDFNYAAAFSGVSEIDWDTARIETDEGLVVQSPRRRY